jgi:hypothetical protein
MAPSIITDSISVSEVCAGGSFEVKFKSNINLKIGEKFMQEEMMATAEATILE